MLAVEELFAQIRQHGGPAVPSPADAMSLAAGTDGIPFGHHVAFELAELTRVADLSLRPRRQGPTAE